MKKEIYLKLLKKREKHPCLFCLLDPDKHEISEAVDLAKHYEDNQADALLIGGSLMINNHFEQSIKEIKKVLSIPVIIFPGIFNFVSSYADAILLLNMISSRNPQLLIEEQVRSAPLIYQANLESIPTAYLLIESGCLSSVQFMSHSLPIPSKKNDIAIVHALAGQYLGMKMIYLEAGSGATKPVPNEMIKAIYDKIEIPIIVGGGIKDPETAVNKVNAGADFIVVGTALEESKKSNLVNEIANAINQIHKPSKPFKDL